MSKKVVMLIVLVALMFVVGAELYAQGNSYSAVSIRIERRCCIGGLATDYFMVAVQLLNPAGVPISPSVFSEIKTGSFHVFINDDSAQNLTTKRITIMPLNGIGAMQVRDVPIRSSTGHVFVFPLIPMPPPHTHICQ